MTGGGILTAEELADYVITQMNEFVPLCNDAEFQAVDRARRYVTQLEACAAAGSRAAQALERIAATPFDRDDGENLERVICLAADAVAEFRRAEAGGEVDLLPSPEGHGDETSPGHIQKAGGETL